MVAVVEVGEGQATKRSKATDEEEPPPPLPMGAVRKHRQPTPDHPPYCWMIGEAIDALCEHGGSDEDSISAFIRARYPGVPAAHDRLLRHYLHKHIAEGFFLRTAAGRYVRSPEEVLDVEHPVEPAAAGSSKEACIGSPVVEARRGRGRPRKDGSSSTSPTVKKDGARSVTPKRRGQRRAAAGLATAEDSVPASQIAVADTKVGSQAASSTPKRRGQGRSTARVAAAEDSVPTSLVAVADTKDGSQAAPSAPKRRGRLRKLGMVTTIDSGKALVPSKKDDSQVPYPPVKEHQPPSELALIVFGDGSATPLTMEKACSKAPPITPGQSPEMALVSTTDVPVPAPTPAMDNKDDHDTPSFNLALVAKNDGICTTSPAPDSISGPCELALVAADDSSIPLLVADKDGVKEAPSATSKHVLQPLKAGSASTGGKKAGSKALSATPKGRRQQRKPAVVATDRSALTPVAGKKADRKVSFASPKLTPVTAGGCSIPASVAGQDSHQARRLYPVTADEIPDDPACCLLALPSPSPLPTAAKA